MNETSQTYTLEEAVARSIPQFANEAISTEHLIKSRPFYFGLGNGHYNRLSELKHLYRNDSVILERLNKTVELQVKGEDYLSTYRALLDTPKSVYHYVALLDPEVKQEISKRKWKEESEEFFWIRSLFGIVDHSGLNVSFREEDERSAESLSRKLEKKLITDGMFIPKYFCPNSELNSAHASSLSSIFNGFLLLNNCI